MWKLFNRVLSPEEARSIAIEICARRGWEFLEPVRIESGLWSWLITTHAGHLGCSARIKVSRRTGKVLCAGYTPR